jgi:hypothetical protein
MPFSTTEPSGFRLDIVILAGHGLANLGIGVRNQAARRDFYLSKTSVLALGSTNPPIQPGGGGLKGFSTAYIGRSVKLHPVRRIRTSRAIRLPPLRLHRLLRDQLTVISYSPALFAFPCLAPVISHLDEFQLMLALGRPTNILPLTVKVRDVCSARWVYMLKPMWLLLFLTTKYLQPSGH